MRVTTAGRLAILTLMLASACSVGCGEHTAPSSPSAEGRTPAADALDDGSVQEAIRLRGDIGMRSDETWVRTVMLDPHAVERWGLLMTVDEATSFDRRISVQLDVIPAIVAYGERYPDDWGGAFIDQRTGNVVVSFAGDLELHSANVRALFAPATVSVEIREVRWSTAELDGLSAQLWTEDAQRWLKDQGATPISGGSRVIENNVLLEVSIPTPDPALIERIRGRFSGDDWLRVEAIVAPAPPTAFGGLELTIVTDRDESIGGVYCWLKPDIPGYAGDQAIRITDETGLCAWQGLGSGGFNVEIRQTLEDGLLATERLTIAPDETLVKTIAVRIGEG